MANILDTVDQRTRLVGENRLEMLTFRLVGKQLFGINVFKVKEVVSLPHLNLLPHRDPVVCGVTHLRGQTISVIDLSLAIGLSEIKQDEKCSIIVCEYNRVIQAFLVSSVDRIVNLNWESLFPPPAGTGQEHFLTAITQLDDDIVEILDVEKVLSDLMPYDTHVSEGILDEELCKHAKGMKILLADDSSVARSQASDALKQVGLDIAVVNNGVQALAKLNAWADEGMDLKSQVLMVVTDAEMPQMDGYRLTTEIRNDPRFEHLYVVLHTSLSGNFNSAMVEKVGCDKFLAKYHPDDLAICAQERIAELLEDS